MTTSFALAVLCSLVQPAFAFPAFDNSERRMFADLHSGTVLVERYYENHNRLMSQAMVHDVREAVTACENVSGDCFVAVYLHTETEWGGRLEFQFDSWSWNHNIWNFDNIVYHIAHKEIWGRRSERESFTVDHRGTDWLLDHLYREGLDLPLDDDAVVVWVGPKDDYMTLYKAWEALYEQTLNTSMTRVPISGLDVVLLVEQNYAVGDIPPHNVPFTPEIAALVQAAERTCNVRNRHPITQKAAGCGIDVWWNHDIQVSDGVREAVSVRGDIEFDLFDQSGHSFRPPCRNQPSSQDMLPWLVERYTDIDIGGAVPTAVFMVGYWADVASLCQDWAATLPSKEPKTAE